MKKSGLEQSQVIVYDYKQNLTTKSDDTRVLRLQASN
jgi:hypothetical protein